MCQLLLQQTKSIDNEMLFNWTKNYRILLNNRVSKIHNPSTHIEFTHGDTFSDCSTSVTMSEQIYESTTPQVEVRVSTSKIRNGTNRQVSQRNSVPSVEENATHCILSLSLHSCDSCLRNSKTYSMRTFTLGS